MRVRMGVRRGAFLGADSVSCSVAAGGFKQTGGTGDAAGTGERKAGQQSEARCFDAHAVAACTLVCRFEREEGEERLPCACGAPTCSGFLN